MYQTCSASNEALYFPFLQPHNSPPGVSAHVSYMLQDLEAYVMDASAINAPFLLNKLANPNRDDGHDGSPSTPSAAAQGPAATEEGPTPPPGQPGDGSSIDGAPRAAEVEPAEMMRAEEPPAFDAVFTNAALHWVRAPRTVIEGAKRVLRPGGR